MKTFSRLMVILLSFCFFSGLALGKTASCPCGKCPCAPCTCGGGSKSPSGGGKHKPSEGGKSSEGGKTASSHHDGHGHEHHGHDRGGHSHTSVGVGADIDLGGIGQRR